MNQTQLNHLEVLTKFFDGCQEWEYISDGFSLHVGLESCDLMPLEYLPDPIHNESELAAYCCEMTAGVEEMFFSACRQVLIREGFTLLLENEYGDQLYGCIDEENVGLVAALSRGALIQRSTKFDFLALNGVAFFKDFNLDKLTMDTEDPLAVFDGVFDGLLWMGELVDLQVMAAAAQFGEEMLIEFLWYSEYEDRFFLIQNWSSDLRAGILELRKEWLPAVAS